jgi:hypothetical protein
VLAMSMLPVGPIQRRMTELLTSFGTLPGLTVWRVGAQEAKERCYQGLIKTHDRNSGRDKCRNCCWQFSR